MMLRPDIINSTITDNIIIVEMFNWFKKSEPRNITFDYSSLMVDMHSHVLPGIDDGAQTPEESIVLIKKMMELGIKKIIATPHIMADYYRNTAETINASLEILKAELEKEKINIAVEAAAELQPHPRPVGHPQFNDANEGLHRTCPPPRAKTPAGTPTGTASAI